MLASLIYGVVGPPPASDATPEERLRWVRRFYRLTVLTSVVAVVVALAGGGTLFWILAAVLALVWAGGLRAISLQIRRSRTRR